MISLLEHVKTKQLTNIWKKLTVFCFREISKGSPLVPLMNQAHTWSLGTVPGPANMSKLFTVSETCNVVSPQFAGNVVKKQKNKQLP